MVVKTDNMGVIVKAGSVGGLEALLRMLEERGIPVRQADIGDISKNDIVDAEVVGEHDPYLGAILGFDSKVLPEAKEYVGTSADLRLRRHIRGHRQLRQLGAAKQGRRTRGSALSDHDPPLQAEGDTRRLLPEQRPGGLRGRDTCRQAEAQGEADDQRRDRARHSGADPGQGKEPPEAKQGEKVAISVEGPDTRAGRSRRTT